MRYDIIYVWNVVLLHRILTIDDHPSGLDYTDTETNENRMQFSGGGGVFEMTMNHDYSSSRSDLSCWHGCGVDHVSNMYISIFPFQRKSSIPH